MACDYHLTEDLLAGVLTSTDEEVDTRLEDLQFTCREVTGVAIAQEPAPAHFVCPDGELSAVEKFGIIGGWVLSFLTCCGGLYAWCIKQNPPRDGVTSTGDSFHSFP